MGRVLIVATAGAGGDLQPLAAAAWALRDRGHELVVLGDGSVERSLTGLDATTEVLPSELDLGPVLGRAIRDAMTAARGDLTAAGPIVQERMAGWADHMAGPVAQAVQTHKPDLLITSLFGVEVLDRAVPPCPWVVVNSTFYVGPDPPRPIEADFGPRAIPLIERYASLLGSPDLVLHATDQVFDFSNTGLPERHHYVGPLGIWEPPSELPSYLDEPGDPWVLVSISSQVQDDVEIAQVALEALGDRPLRLLVTLGPGHAPAELSLVPSNARVAQLISHAGVMRRAALLLSHAGHGSVMKALWFGCPMVLMPWGRDQPGVATRAEALGTAKVVPRDRVSVEAIRNASDRILIDEGIRERAHEIAARLQATDPPRVAAELIGNLF